MVHLGVRTKAGDRLGWRLAGGQSKRHRVFWAVARRVAPKGAVSQFYGGVGTKLFT